MAEIPNPVTVARQIANELGRRAFDLVRAFERYVRTGYLKPGPRDD